VRAGWSPPLPASCGGNHPPALWRRRPPAMPGKANCCCPARTQHSVLLLTFVARTGVRTCRCALPTISVGGEADATVCADVGAAGGSFPPPPRRGRRRRLRTGPRLFGFNVWFASLEWGREREPSGGRVRPGTIAAAVGAEPEFCLHWHLECRCLVHCGYRGLNMYVLSARGRVFSSFRALRLACRLSEPLHRA
jgi:hypothetical protein